MRRIRRLALRIALGIAVAGSVLPLVACGPPPPPPAAKPKEAAWQDALEGDEALVAVIRPKALARDPVYGPLLRSGFAVATSKEGSTPSIDILSSAEEVILVLPGKKKDGPLLVLTGMDASRDPERAADEHGTPLFRHGADARGVSELTSTTGKDASLFVIGRRTWVIASGGARSRARVAFANPAGRPVPSYGEESALALARFDGPSLLEGIPRIRGALSSVSKNLATATFALMPDEKGVNVTLSYANDDQAGVSAVMLDDIKKHLATEPGGRFAWATKASIDRDGNRDVKIHVEIPPQVVEQLQRVSPADLSSL